MSTFDPDGPLTPDIDPEIVPELTPELVTLGWREWLSLPALGIKRIKAKIDTGARTSALHVDMLEHFAGPDGPWVRFRVHPHQRDESDPVLVEVPLLEERSVRSSNGKVEVRPVIQTLLRAGKKKWPIEITLASRGSMKFRMLIGREALRGRALVNPGVSYLTKRPKKKPVVDTK